MTQFTMGLALLCCLCSCTTQGAKNIGGSGGSAEPKEIMLSDGTKCAVIVGYGKAAISCGWK